MARSAYVHARRSCEIVQQLGIVAEIVLPDPKGSQGRATEPTSNSRTSEGGVV